MTALDPFFSWEAIEHLLPVDFRERAVAHKQIQTQFGNAKITSAEELLRMLFAHVLSETPLRQTVIDIEKAGGPRLSAMRLHMKLRQAAPYLLDLLQCLAKPSDLFEDGTPDGVELIALDAADVVGPGSTCAPARVHVAMRIEDLRISAVSVADASERDGLRRFLWSAGQVVVANGAETTAASIERVLAHGAHVVLEVNGVEEATLETVDGLRLDAAARARLASLTPLVEMPARFADAVSGRAVMGRLVLTASAAPAREVESTGSYPVAKRARDDANATGTLIEPVAIFTTLPREAFSAVGLGTLHAAAAQILETTSGWKAKPQASRLANQREDTTLSWLYAKMVLGILQRRADAAEDTGIEIDIDMDDVTQVTA